MRNEPMQRKSIRTVTGALSLIAVILGMLILATGSLALWPFSDWGEKDEGKTEASHAGVLAGRRVACLTNPPHARSSEILAEWFHEETGAVARNIVVDYGEMLNFTLKDMGSTNRQLDVIMLWYADLGTLVERGALEDLTELIEQNTDILRPDDFISSLYDPYTLYKGRRWALPYDGDTHVLFYRKSIFKKHGFTPPETWKDYLNIARTITEKEKSNGLYGTAIMLPPIPMISVSSFMDRLGGYGGKLLDGNGVPSLNSPEAVAALTAMVEQARYALPTPLETDWEVSRDAFLSGKVAMAEQWTDIGLMAEDPTQSLIQGDWGVVQMPKGEGSKASHAPALNSGFSLGISKGASDPEAARAFVLFATRPDVTLRLNLVNGGIDPTRISVLNSAEYRKYAPDVSAATRAALDGALAWPTVPQTPALLESLAKNLILAVEGHKSPREALDTAQTRWMEILEPRR